MASVRHLSATRWVVNLASQSDSDSEITVELRMSKKTADELAHAEVSRLAALNPGRDDLPVDDVGSAVLGILSSFAAINRVKGRVAHLDQENLMEFIEREVGDALADRP